MLTYKFMNHFRAWNFSSEKQQQKIPLLAKFYSSLTGLDLVT